MVCLRVAYAPSNVAGRAKSVCRGGADRTPGVQVRALRNVVASLSLALSPVLSVFCILLLVLSIGAKQVRFDRFA